jgi:regulation of enolase protein 1 (concanavalin A-like superfamily)
MPLLGSFLIVKGFFPVSPKTLFAFFVLTFVQPWFSFGQSGAPVSDDFNGTSLNTALWTQIAPAGGSVVVANGHANFTVPGGADHDPVVGGNNSVRILQNITNANFDVTAKFDSAPSKQYQGEGILVQQDSANYLRLEFSSNGSRTVVSANSISGGAQTLRFEVTLTNAPPPLWLQVARAGSTFTISYSFDGATYLSAGGFSQSLAVSAIGPYAWNYNSPPANAPATTAVVDYFYNLSGSAAGNPPVISGISASAAGNQATISWQTNEPSTSGVNWGTTASYGSSNSNSGLVTSHSSSILNLQCNTTYDFQVVSTNAQNQTTDSNNKTFSTGPCSGPAGPVSDNFDGPSLNTNLWTFINPLGNALVTMNGTAATINVPHGANHDPWTGGNGAVRLMQNVPNSNFGVTVRFQSDVELPNQDEGILIQQDAADFIRFDVLYNGSGVQLFAAAIRGSSSTVFANSPIAITQAPIWLQLQRTGNDWIGRWSTDGVHFALGASFTYSMNVTSIGPYAGTASSTPSLSPSFTAIVDYFFNTASPLSNLDGPPPFRAITIDPNPPATLVEKALADIQGTGHLDAVVGFEQPSAGIYWYEYPASGRLTDKWNKHPIVTSGNAYEDILPLDVNKDGAVDIVASYASPGSSTFNVVWFENPRGRGGNPATDAWPMTVIGAGEGENNLILADIDGDGKIDVVTAHHIYFQNSPTSWTAVQYNSAFRGVALLDIGSGRGPIDLVSTNSALNAVWFENPRETGGNARTGKWIMHNVGAGYPCNSTDCPNGDDYVAAYNTGDFNGDGRMDIVMAQSEAPGGGVAPPPGGMVWFEAPADRRNGTWTRHTIDTQFVDAHCVRVADMDHNGTLDLVTSEQDQSRFRRVSVFYNDGAGNFTQEIVSNAEGHQTTIGDVQGIGEIDILNSGHGYFGDPHPLQLFLNPVK